MRLDSPIKLESERAWRTYHGGMLLDRIHGVEPARDTHFPEDWIISTVRAINAGRENVVEGLNKISRIGGDAAPGPATLADLIAAQPEAALGAAHVARWGATPAVLVKLIDSAERLGIQCHPDKAKAREYFNSPFGKTECWHIVGKREIGGEKPCVYMGFKPDVTGEAWRGAFDRQDVPAMLSMLHRIEVQIGDTFLIEGGMPHAIGAGCLLVEIQEPTDYTFRTEKVTLQGYRNTDEACHYGIGFDRMFECFHYEGFDEAETRRKRMVPQKVLEETDGFRRVEIVGYGETPCFALEKIEIARKYGFSVRTGASGIQPVFSGLYVLSGRGVIRSAAGETRIAPGDQFFVPAECREYEITASRRGEAGEPSPLVVYRAHGALS